MTTYQLKVEINKAWIGQFNTHGMKLCFASCVESSGTSNFNVVSFADKVADSVTIEWKEEYSIAASTTKFSDAVKFTTSTKPQEITYGQTFPIDETWVTQPINNDEQAPKAEFRFQNGTIASAVVYQKVMGEHVAVYFSALGPLPPGTEDLEPKPRARLWFSAHHETGSMVSNYASKPFDIDLTGKTQASVRYEANGKWNKL